MLLQRTRLLSDLMAISAVPVPINLESLGQVVWCCCQECIYLRLRHLASWQSPLTRQYSSKFLESGIRAVQCYDCPTGSVW